MTVLKIARLALQDKLNKTSKPNLVACIFNPAPTIRQNLVFSLSK